MVILNMCFVDCTCVGQSHAIIYTDKEPVPGIIVYRCFYWERRNFSIEIYAVTRDKSKGLFDAERISQTRNIAFCERILKSLFTFIW